MATKKSLVGLRPPFEFAPDQPELVERALRAIQSGWCDEGGTERLADALGVGDELLDGQFEEFLGQSPSQVQHSRLRHFCQTLRDHSGLPIAAIATGAGFGSADEVVGLLGGTITDDRSPKGRAQSGLMIPVPHWPGVDIDTTMAYLASRAIPGIESVEEGAYIRTVKTAAGASATIRIVPTSNDLLELHIGDSAAFAGPGELLALTTQCRHLFALDEPLASCASGLLADPILGPYVEANPGLRLAGTWDPFETAIRIVVGQQVTVAAASTLAGRLVDRFGVLEPEALAMADLTGMGMPGARARTISNLAAAVMDGTVDLRAVSTLKQSVADLTSVVGIGPWTAQLIAARVLRHPDAFPPKDLGLMRAYERLGGSEPVESAAKRWQPRRAAAIAYLWFSDTVG